MSRPASNLVNAEVSRGRKDTNTANVRTVDRLLLITKGSQLHGSCQKAIHTKEVDYDASSTLPSITRKPVWLKGEQRTMLLERKQDYYSPEATAWVPSLMLRVTITNNIEQ